MNGIYQWLASSSFTSPGGTRESYCPSASSSCDSSNSVLLANLPRSPAALAIVPHSQLQVWPFVAFFFPTGCHGDRNLVPSPSALRGSARHLLSSVA